MITCANIEAALWHHLPADLHGVVPVLAQVLADAATGAMSPADAQAHFAASPERISALRALAGHEVTAGGTLIAFGAGNQIGTVSIGDVAGGNIVKLALTVGVIQSVTVSGQATVGTIIGTQHIHAAPSPAERDQKLRALLHDHSGFIASRMEAFVGRTAELAEIRARIAEKLPTGGYVTITGQAGQGKSSVIARLVADALGDSATLRERLLEPGAGVPVCHFIPFSPGPDHQVGLLRNLIARLCLTYGLPDFYAASDSRPALRDYFAAALRDMAKQGHQEIIYIDGLDQIEEDASGVRDLSFLPEEPPAGVVFVLGTRPNDTLKPLELRKPQHEYWLPALSRVDFDLILAHRGVQLDVALATRFYVAMQENALYLDLVARELAQADATEPEQIIARVADNPANLFSLSIERLQRNERQWETMLRPLLGLLLTTRAPLSQRALRALIGADELRTKQGLQRLGGLIQRDGEGRYGLFHLKLGEFLRQQVFADDEVEGYHQQLVGWCEGGKGGINAIWQDVPSDALEQERRGYARQHYIAHLAAACNYERLWTVIDAGDYGKSKRRHDPSTRSYALDLDIARQAVVDAAGGDADAQSRALPKLWRYSLLRCSLTSQADNYPKEFFLALVALGRSSDAINLAEMMTNPKKRTSTIYAIGTAVLSRKITEGVNILQRARQTTKDIPETIDRVEILRNLVRAFAQARCWDDAYQTVVAIPYDCECVAAFGDLVATFIQAGHRAETEAVLAMTRQITTAISHEWSRNIALSTLANTLAQAGRWDEAHQTATAISNSQDRARALSTLASALAQAGRWDEAHQIATAIPISNSQDRARALSTLASALAQAGHMTDAEATFAMVRQTIAVIPNNWEHTNALRDLVHTFAQSRRWDEAHQIATAIPNSQDRARALSTLASTLAQAGHITDAEATFAMVRQTIAVIPNNWERTNALRDLVHTFAQSRRWDEACQTAAAITENNVRTRTLYEIVPAIAHAGYMTEAEIIFTTTRQNDLAIFNNYIPIEYLCTLAGALAQARCWDNARQTITMLPTGKHRSNALRTLAATLSQAKCWDDAYQTATAIPDDSTRADALRTLAVTLAQAGYTSEAKAAFTAAHQTATAIPTNKGRARVLSTLAYALVQAKYWDEARQSALAVPDDLLRTVILRDLACALAQAGHIAEAEANFTAVRQIVVTIPDDNIRANALRDLASALAQAELWDDAHQIIAAISYRRPRAAALSRVAVRLAQVGLTAEAKTAFATAHQIATTVPGAWECTKALSDFALTLAQSGYMMKAEMVFMEARETAMKVAAGNQRIEVLSMLARALTQIKHWDDARQIATTIPKDNFNTREKVFETIATALLQANQWNDAYQIAISMLHNLQCRIILRSVIIALFQAGLLHQSICMLSDLWCRAQTRDELLSLFDIDAALFRAYPELGQAFLDSFAWVDAQLALG